MFSKITSENTIVLPTTPESIKEMTGVVCEPEKIFEFNGDKYQTFAIELYSGRDIGYAIMVDETNKPLVINLAPTTDLAKGIHIIYPSSLTDDRMKFCIYARPEDILNGYLYGRSTLDNKWFNFICEYLDWYELQHDRKIFCRGDDRNYKLRMNQYMMKYSQFSNRPTTPNESMNPNKPVRIPNGGGKLSKIIITSLDPTSYPIAVKTFKTPIQDQRLIEADLEITNWIGNREIISISSVVSDNKLIRTVVVKNK